MPPLGAESAASGGRGCASEWVTSRGYHSLRSERKQLAALQDRREREIAAELRLQCSASAGGLPPDPAASSDFKAAIRVPRHLAGMMMGKDARRVRDIERFYSERHGGRVKLDVGRDVDSMGLIEVVCEHPFSMRGAEQVLAEAVIHERVVPLASPDVAKFVLGKGGHRVKQLKGESQVLDAQVNFRADGFSKGESSQANDDEKAEEKAGELGISTGSAPVAKAVRPAGKAGKGFRSDAPAEIVISGRQDAVDDACMFLAVHLSYYEEYVHARSEERTVNLALGRF